MLSYGEWPTQTIKLKQCWYQYINLLKFQHSGTCTPEPIDQNVCMYDAYSLDPDTRDYDAHMYDSFIHDA